MKKLFVAVMALLICAGVARAGLIPTPAGSNLEFLGKVSVVEAYDVTLDRNATRFTADLISYKCYSMKAGYNLEKSRWVVGAGLDINGFAVELKNWTKWDLTVPILDQLKIKTTFLTTYAPVTIPTEPTWTFQVGAQWDILKF